jgi:transcriptional regulator with XRE-family HTH domain
MILAELSRRVRANNAWSMEVLSRRSGLSKNQISLIEKGKGNNLTVTNIYGLAGGLKASPAVVLAAAKEGLDQNQPENGDE